MPEFHALLVVRDEADILPQTLPAILAWADSVHVFDTGSTDGTWEYVRDLASREARVRCVGREEVLFSVGGVTAWLFDRVRGGFRRGDWVVRADADEFYHVPPTEFVRTRLSRHEGRVFGAHYDFQFTQGEWRSWCAGLESEGDRARPIRDRRRWYEVNEHKELRLFRYRPSMRWPPGEYEPMQGGLVARARIPILHYAKRDPPQIRRRFALRCATRQAGQQVGKHWEYADWRRTIVDEGRLKFWQPGTPLPEHERVSFARTGWRRGAAWAYYASGAAAARDAARPRFPKGYRPPTVPREVAARMAELDGGCRGASAWGDEAPLRLRRWCDEANSRERGEAGER